MQSTNKSRAAHTAHSTSQCTAQRDPRRAGRPHNKEAPYLYEGRCAEPWLASSPCVYPLLLQSPNRCLLARPGPRLPHLHTTSLLAPSPHGDLTARKRSLGQRTPPRPHSIDGSRARWATTRRLRVASWADAEGEKKHQSPALRRVSHKVTADRRQGRTDTSK